MTHLEVRQKCMEEFKKLPFQNFHEGWHLWKRAFHLGYELAKTENKKGNSEPNDEVDCDATGDSMKN